MSHLWYRLLPADTINQILKIKKCHGAPSERDPLLRLLDHQTIDEVPCHGTGRRWPTIVGGEPQRLLDDVAERGAVAAALEWHGPVTASTSQ
jgi:hypothetical protein